MPGFPFVSGKIKMEVGEKKEEARALVFWSPKGHVNGDWLINTIETKKGVMKLIFFSYLDSMSMTIYNIKTLK